MCEQRGTSLFGQTRSAQTRSAHIVRVYVCTAKHSSRSMLLFTPTNNRVSICSVVGQHAHIVQEMHADYEERNMKNAQCWNFGRRFLLLRTQHSFHHLGEISPAVVRASVLGGKLSCGGARYDPISRAAVVSVQTAGSSSLLRQLVWRDLWRDRRGRVGE